MELPEFVSESNDFISSKEPLDIEFMSELDQRYTVDIPK